MRRISPQKVRYIKLGQAGTWEKECLEKGIIRFGFGTANPERFLICKKGRWNDLIATLIKDGRGKGIAKNIANQTQSFFEDDGATLWIAFVEERLWWGFLDRAPPEPHKDGAGVWRKVKGGWKATDIKGEELIKDRLSGALTKLVGFLGTSCQVDVAEYVVHRINGEKPPEVEAALVALQSLRTSIPSLLKKLNPYDFELLVDLVFSASGWRRLTPVGGAQKTKDIALELPTTGEQVFVQVKSKTTSKELAKYAATLDGGPYGRLFYVHHSGNINTDDERVIVVGPEQLADLVLDAGLTMWLIRKCT